MKCGLFKHKTLLKIESIIDSCINNLILNSLITNLKNKKNEF